MKIKEFIDTRVRPLIGDSLTTNNNPTMKQITKYPIEVLIDYLNEGVLDIAENSKLFIKKGATLLKEGDTSFKLPNDFKGWYGTKDVSVGKATNFDTSMPHIKLKPNIHGVDLESPITRGDITRYTSVTQKVTVPSDIIELLVKSGQIVAPAIPQLTVGMLSNKILITYYYLYIPPEFDADAVITDRYLMYLLKWWVAGNALYGDMHNEASNLAGIYERKYLRRLEQAGQKQHNWNSISLSPYTPKT